MYLPIVLHSLCIIQILMFFNARSNVGAQGGFTCGPLHNQKAWLCTYHMSESPEYFSSLLFIAKSEETAPRSEGRYGKEQQSVRVFEFPGLWSQSNEA